MMVPLKRLLERVVRGRTVTGAFTEDGEYPWWNPAALGDALTMGNPKRRVPANRVVAGDFPRAPAGSTAFSFIGNIGRSALLEADGVVNEQMICLVPAAHTHPRYLAYLSRAIGPAVDSLAFHTVVRYLPLDTLLRHKVPQLPLHDQKAIVAFLDVEADRIDALIAKKRRMIQLLKERFRREVEARTADGSAARVRFTTSLITSGPRGWGDFVMGTGAPFVRSANLRRSSIGLRLDDLVRVMPPASAAVEARRSRLAQGDVIVGITGANTGWVGFAGPEVNGGYVSQHVALLRPHGISGEWLAYSVFSHRAQGLLLGGQYGGTKQQLGLAELAELPLHVPDIEVQHTHVAALRALRDRTERGLALLSSQIALLEEHRQALITAAVTGELQVPGVAA